MIGAVRSLGEVAEDDKGDGRAQFVEDLVGYVAGTPYPWPRVAWRDAQALWSRTVSAMLEHKRCLGDMEIAEQMAIEFIYVSLLLSPPGAP